MDDHGDWETCRRTGEITIFKNGKKEDPRNYRLVTLTSVPGKVMEQLNLGTISRHMEVKRMTGCCQYGFAKGKSHLINLITFYNELMGLVEKAKAYCLS